MPKSKKWKSPQTVDEQGKPVYDEKGKAVLVPTYSILQDEFFEHMQAAGFADFAHRERGGTAENQSSLQYQINRDKKRLAQIQVFHKPPEKEIKSSPWEPQIPAREPLREVERQMNQIKMSVLLGQQAVKEAEDKKNELVMYTCIPVFSGSFLL